MLFRSARLQYALPDPPAESDNGIHIDRRYEKYVENGDRPAAIRSALIKWGQWASRWRYSMAKVVLPAPLGPASSFAVVCNPFEPLFKRVKSSIDGRSESQVLMQNMHVREKHSCGGPQTLIYVPIR